MENTSVSSNIETIGKLMTRKEAARHIMFQYGIPMSPLTLDKYASQGGGPRFQKFSRRVFYDAREIEVWVKSRLTPFYQSTSDEARGSSQ